VDLDFFISSAPASKNERNSGAHIRKILYSVLAAYVKMMTSLDTPLWSPDGTESLYLNGDAPMV
jgi:hypothetical protein